MGGSTAPMTRVASRQQSAFPALDVEWTTAVAVLLAELSRRIPEWAVLKNHERLPMVTGDIDACAPRARWDDVLSCVLDVLGQRGRHVVVICDHYLGVRLLFAARLDHPSGRALEMDLADGLWWKGHQLLPARSLLEHATWDTREFRRLTAGAEAAVLLTLSGMRRSGGLAAGTSAVVRAREKARMEPYTFVEVMAAAHGIAGRRAARRFLRGAWSTPTGAALVGRRALRGPAAAVRRVVAFGGRKVAGHWRGGLPRAVGGDPGRWLERVGTAHTCLRPGGGAS